MARQQRHRMQPWLGGLAAVLALVPAVAMTATFVVNSTADAEDTLPGDGVCSTSLGPTVCTLRAAVQEADAAPGSTTIALPAGTYTLSVNAACPFQWGANPTDVVVQQTRSLCINRSLVLVGDGAASTIIDANQPAGDLGLASPVFFVGTQAVVDVSGVTIKRGNYSFGGTLTGQGGGIRNAGKLTLDGVIVSDNFANTGGGGGIYNTGQLALLRSQILRNTSMQTGGGIANFGQFGIGGTVRIEDSVVAHNSGTHGGGVGNFQGTVALSGTTVSDNAAGTGGGLWNGNFNTMTLVNVTVSGNRANNAGGIQNEFAANMTIVNATITNNTAQWTGEPRGLGGGLNVNDNATTRVRNTILAGNFAAEQGPDCITGRTTITSEGYNLFGSTASCGIAGDATGNLVNVDPKLGLLLDNGGPTPTHALGDTSPAIDAGSPAVPGSGGNACAAADQMGFLRPIGERCDIGAAERRGSFDVARIAPKAGGNAGPVSATIAGGGFAQGATVAMRRAGQPDIPGQFIGVDTGGSALTASFDLAGRPTGAWDVVVTNPGGSTRTLPAAFVVEAGGAPDLWVDVVGVVRRPGRKTVLSVLYGNRGKVDAVGVPLSLSLPRGLQAGLVASLEHPPLQPGETRPDWQQVSLAVARASPDAFVQVPLFLPLVPAGATNVLSVTLTLQNDSTDTHMVAAIGDAMLAPAARGPFIASSVVGVQSYLQNIAGLAVPAAALPDLQQYVSSQFDEIVHRARTTFAGSVSTRLPVYSLAQLQLDFAFFAGPRSTSGASASRHERPARGTR